MPDTFRALCAELIDALDSGLMANRIRMSPLAARARAALAATPDTDDVLQLAAIIRDVDGNHDKGAAALAEAILEHSGYPAARAALAEGEARPSDDELLDCKNRAVRKHLDGYRGPSEAVFSADEILAGQAAGLRAVLARYGSASRPVPVSERLPGPEDCDAEGRCWFGCPSSDVQDSYWVLRKAKYRRSWDTHWLPAHAIPLPQKDTDV